MSDENSTRTASRKVSSGGFAAFLGWIALNLALRTAAVLIPDGWNTWLLYAVVAAFNIALAGLVWGEWRAVNRAKSPGQD